MRGQFERASAILFTGAGFSLGTRNLGGGPPPLAGTLKGELWNLCFPGEAFDPATSGSLADLYHAASSRHRNDLDRLLSRLYTIDGGSVPDWYRSFFEGSWLRCYTLNVDDLSQAAARKFELPRRIRVISAPKPMAVVGAAEVPAQVLDVVHLNGMVTDGPEGMTFSVPQYAQRLANPMELWYIRVSADLLSHSFVFVGTQLDEPPLWQHLELRRARGGREMRELRPKSYLVTPTLDRPRQALLSDFNVVWLPMTAEEFAVRILAPLGDAGRTGLAYLRKQSVAAPTGAHSLGDVATLAGNPTQTSEFLLGQEPIWADVQANRAIARESDEEAWAKVEAARKRAGTRGFLVVTGTAGSGKSAALMRLCLRLVAKGVKVGWVDRDNDIPPREIRSAMRAENAPVVLVIDDADAYGAELSSLLREVCIAEPLPLVIVGVRSGRLERVLNPARLEGIPAGEVVMPGLTDRDIGALLDVLDRENRLGVLKGKSRTEQEQVFREKAGRQLLVAMIEATSNRRFEEKAIEELVELETEARHVYALVAVASAFRFNLTRDEILIATGDHSNATLNVVDQLVRRNILIDVPGVDGGLRARHRHIAEIIREELVRRGQMREVLFGLALLAATKVRPDIRRGARPWRLLRTIISHEFLQRALGHEDARNLYGSIEQALAWDYHYWLQRGSLEVESGDINLAQNFLSQAKGLAPDDEPFVQNEWAYLLFKRALEAPKGLDAPKLVEEATVLLEDLITRRGLTDSYPYHVLGSQGLAWSRRGITSAVERGRYLAKLLKRTEEGVGRHAHATDLRQLLDDVRKDYLSIAVSGH